VVIDYTGPGTLTVYEDSKTSGTAFDYGTNPPNGTAPPSVVDGTPIIVGSVTNFRFVYNTNTGSGSYDSDFTVVGGSQFGSIPASQQSGWQFAGTTSNSISIPQGYEHQVVGQTFLGPPTATTSESWGQIKRRYR
jgi:hypothetical protein